MRIKRRRSNADIQAEILTHANIEIKPTVLMSRCNLSWQPLWKQLDWLKSHDLVSIRSTIEDERRDKRSYEVIRTTQRGMEELLVYRHIMKVLAPLVR